MNYSDISFPNQRSETLINTLSDSGWVHSDKKQMLWEIQLLKERNALRMVDYENCSIIGYFKRMKNKVQNVTKTSNQLVVSKDYKQIRT